MHYLKVPDEIICRFCHQPLKNIDISDLIDSEFRYVPTYARYSQPLSTKFRHALYNNRIKCDGCGRSQEIFLIIFNKCVSAIKFNLEEADALFKQELRKVL